MELARALAAAREPLDAVRSAAERARLALGGSMAAISRWERERGRLRVLVNTGRLAPGEEELPEEEAYPVADFPEIVQFLHRRWKDDRSAHAWVETAEGSGEGRDPGPDRGTGEGRDQGGDPGRDQGGGRRHPRVEALRRRGRTSCVVAPIPLHGLAWGELYVAREAGQPVFDERDAEFATVLAALISAGLVQTEELEHARRLAHTDPLTGLANRRAVDARLEEALERHRESGTPVSLAMCDMNGLKRVNDEHGHDVGDRLLTGFANQLSLCAAMLPGSLAGRLGGDEFCLVTEGHAADDVVAVAEEVCRRALLLPYGEGAACGVASTDGPIGTVRSPARLFRLADAAQYQAKAAGSLHPVAAGGDSEADAPPPRRGERRRFRGVRDRRRDP